MTQTIPNTSADYDPNNIFAKIIRGDLPSNKVLESTHTLGFHDISPQAPIHIIVVPKGAYIDLTDFLDHASPEEQIDFLASISEIIKSQKLADHGFRTIANTGEYAEPEVPHFHLHLLGGKKLGRMLPQ